MRVLFLNGPSQDDCDRFFGWPTSLLYAIAPTVHAIRTGRLSAEIAGQIFEPLWFIQEENAETVSEEFGRRAANVDVICASATYDAYYPTLRLLEVAKRENPTVVTILGGPHADEVHQLPAHAPQLNYPHLFDYVIAGDGEYALLGVLEHLVGLRNLPEVAALPGRFSIWHGQNRIRGLGPDLDLDEIPAMPTDLADVQRHENDFDIFWTDGRPLRTAQMIAKRGCPYNCLFCSERRALAHPLARSIDSIMKEIFSLKDKGFEAVFFDDSTFGSYPRIGDLLRELESSGLVFGCLNRFNHLNSGKTVEAYARAGFRYMYCAVEQFCDSTLATISKGQTESVICRAMDVLEDNSVALGVSLLYGLPSESKRSVDATLTFTEEWVKRGLIVLVSESVFSYHPGTPLGRAPSIRFDCPPPNQGSPFSAFEEGQWYHPPHVTAKYLESILEESKNRFGNRLVRYRHSWHRRSGLVRRADSQPFQKKSRKLDGLNRHPFCQLPNAVN